MAGKKNTIDLDQAVDILARLAIIDAEKRRLRSELFAYVRAEGGVSAHGLHCYHQQTTGYAYDPDMVADALVELLFGNVRESKRKWNEVDVVTTTTEIQRILCYLLSSMDNRAMKSHVVEKGEFSEIIQSFLGRPTQDPHGQGGMRPINGKPTIDTRETPPLPGQHHIIRPGTEALELHPRPEKADEPAQSA